MKNISHLPILAGHLMQLCRLGAILLTANLFHPGVMKPGSPRQTHRSLLSRLSRQRRAWKESLRLIFPKINNARQPALGTQTQMQITERLDGSVMVIAIGGPIDLTTSSHLRAYLQLKVAQRAPDIMLDLARVTRVESTGLATLVEFLRSTQRFGGHLVLTALSSRVQSAFEIMRLDQVFSIYSDRTAALTALKLIREE